MRNREGPPESSGAPLFGELFRSYRDRESLSQRKAARILGVDESTVAKLEAGTRKPPRDVIFYERLRDLPGVTEAEIAALLKTHNAPKWLVAERGREDIVPAPKFSVAKVGNISAIINLEAPANIFPAEDLDDIREIVRRTVTLTLRNVLRQRGQISPGTNLPQPPIRPEPPQTNP